MDAAAGVYAATYFIWLAVRAPGTPWSQRVGMVAFLPLGPAVAWACWNNSRLAGLDFRTRLAWRLFVLSALLLWISGSAWDGYSLVVGPEEWPAWIDHLESLQHPVLIAALLVFPGRSFAGRHRTRFLLDATLVVIAGTVMAVYFGLRLWFVEMPSEPLWTAIQGPILDWPVLLAAAVGALGKRDDATRRSLGFVVAAGVVYLVANYYYTIGYYPDGAPAYVAGNAVDGLWFTAWVFRWFAARSFGWRRLDAEAHTTNDPGTSSRYETGGFAYLVVGGCLVLLTGRVLVGDEHYQELLACSALAMIAVLIARQLMELRESNRLVEAQVAQEARLRALVDRSSDAVLIVGSGGVVTYASPTAASVFGPDAPVRAGARLIDAVREDDRGLIEPVLEGRGGSRRVVVHVQAGVAEWREVEAVWTDLRTDPAVNGLVINCRDVTDRSELEQQLRHAQKLDAVGQLAGGLAHDINNALAVVRGYSELLKDEFEPGSASIADVVHIEQAVDRAASITRKVLAFSRKQAAQPTVLDLSAVVRELLPMLRQSVSPRIEVRLELEPRVWPIRADRGQVEQVLVNLATNARDAMAQGGELTISTANLVVTQVSADTSAAPPGEYVALTVRDQGTGMTPEVRARIFEPFFTTKTASGGMGLGLAMVHGIVQSSKGRIVVVTAPGRGAVFTILLPRSEAGTIAGADADAAGEQRAPGLRVLVVDDEDSVRFVARRMLERVGYHVVEARDGLGALEILEDAGSRVDVLLTDLVMPGLDGRQLIARCATLKPSLPIVCMTGFAGEDDRPAEYGSNLVALLSKPFSSESLVRAVAAAAAKAGAA